MVTRNNRIKFRFKTVYLICLYRKEVQFLAIVMYYIENSEASE